MLKKEHIKKIAELLKLKETDLETAIAAKEEVDITIDDKLSTFTETELTTLKANEYKTGKTAGLEMEIKAVKEKQGLEFTGKTLDGLVEAISKKALEDAKIEPNKQVQDLQAKVTTLQNTVKEFEGKVQERETELSTVRTHSELYKHIPEFGDNGPAIERDDVIAMMGRSGYAFKTENGKTVPYKDGIKLTDKLGEVLPVKEVVSGFLKEKKLVVEGLPGPGGRGGKDKLPTGTKATKLSELKKQFTDEGKSLLGEEFKNAFAEASKDAEFDANS